MERHSCIEIDFLPGRLHIVALALAVRDGKGAAARIVSILREEYDDAIDGALRKLLGLVNAGKYHTAMLLVNAISLKVYDVEQ